ncbi:MAG: G-D-S-L lipolytic protein [Oceanospirillaceae bacterium]|nr:G-D-S-L lipolytic protein [Oceanospirillaceae bacterium]
MNTDSTDCRATGSEIAFWVTLGALSPVIAWQGKQVRRQTLRLPEAAGKREQLNDDDHFRVLIVGDSAAAGVGVEEQSDALLGQLVSRLSKNHPVGFRLSANTGDSSADLLRKLQADKTDTRTFDLVIISIGVNDVTGFTSLARWGRLLRTIRAEIQQRFQPATILFTQVPPMHHFPALPQPLRWLLGWRARQLNTILNKTLRPEQVLNVSIPFDDIYMATDGFHPGKPGYSLWAEEVMRSLNAPDQQKHPGSPQ